MTTTKRPTITSEGVLDLDDYRAINGMGARQAEDYIDGCFDRALSRYPAEMYHRERVLWTFPRGYNAVYYARKDLMTEREFERQLSQELDEVWRELSSY